MNLEARPSDDGKFIELVVSNPPLMPSTLRLPVEFAGSIVTSILSAAVKCVENGGPKAKPADALIDGQTLLHAPAHMSAVVNPEGKDERIPIVFAVGSATLAISLMQPLARDIAEKLLMITTPSGKRRM